MKTSTVLREENKWPKSYLEWADDDGVHLSVVFSWLLGEAIDRAAELMAEGRAVDLGGPAAEYAGVAYGNGVENALRLHNPNACKTSVGCVNHCPFCIVPVVEGELRELPTWEPKPIVCDNNLLACSRAHFDKVIDSLKGVKDVDFNQGLDARILTNHHAERLRELDLRYIRIAWDSIGYESKFMQGWDVLRRAGFPRSKIAVYVLIGFHDTPEDALYRLQMVRRLGGWPFPMRYQPLDAVSRNSYAGDGWTNRELVRYCHYWSMLRVTSRIPFAEFQYGGQCGESELRE